MKITRLANQTVVQARTWGLTWAEADRSAIRAGLHPATVWPDLWWSAIPEPDELADARKPHNPWRSVPDRRQNLRRA